MRLGRGQRIVVMITLVVLAGELFWPRIDNAWFWWGQYRHDLHEFQHPPRGIDFVPDTPSPQPSRQSQTPPNVGDQLRRLRAVEDDKNEIWRALWVYEYEWRDIIRITLNMLGTVLVSVVVLLAVAGRR